MKILSVLFLVTLLASCGTTSTTPEQTQPIIEDQASEMDNNMSEFDNEEMDENKMETIEYSYTNPAQEVNMVIDYSLNSEDKIESINVSATNWDKLGDFDAAVKSNVIGLTLEEASEMPTVSGASITSEAFKEAIKSQL
ncbi:MAG: FMN-binding protein [Patescibacteria group bacterium]